MSREQGIQNLRKLNNHKIIEVQHNPSDSIQKLNENRFEPNLNSTGVLLFETVPKKANIQSCEHECGQTHNNHDNHNFDNQGDSLNHGAENNRRMGHGHKKHKSLNDKPMKNYGIIFYTIFTCISCWYLQSQHLNPIRGDYLSKILTYLCYFDVILCLWSYIQTFRIRNTVPKMSKMMNVDTIGNKIVDPQYSLTANHCQACHYFKLPRVSHCSTCKQCIYKLDHHCMWTQTCIGFCNQRPFICFCVYMTIGVIQFWVSTARALGVMTESCESRFFTIFQPGVYILWAITCFSAGVVGIMILALTLSHIIMIFTNYTTLDCIKKKTRPPFPFVQCQPYFNSGKMINTFDRGQIQNIRSLFGTNILTFWLPLGRSIQNQFIIEPMNPQPSKLQLMRQTSLYTMQSQIDKQVQKILPRLKQIYKDKIFILDGQKIVI